MHTTDAVCWKRNLICVWVAQMLSLMGFAFAMSFAAYYIQALGVTEPNAVKIWTGIYQAAGPLTFGLMSPVWGALGDRFGRRLMMLRASFAAAVIVFAMGCVSSVEQLVVLRLIQGVFTGTVSAALTLVATTTPVERHGVALGSLQTATVVGWMTGSALGGILADKIGYAATIRLAALLLLLSATIVLLFVREEFQRPQASGSRAAAGREWLQHAKAALPICVLFLFVSMSRRFDSAVLPLFIQQLNQGRLDGAATRLGQLTAVCSAAVALSSVAGGWLVDRVRPVRVAVFAACTGGIMAGVQYWATGFVSLTVIRTCLAFCLGGLEPACQVWLTQSTPQERRGRIIGLSVSARSLGWITASLSSAYLATRIGIRLIFPLEGFLLLLLVPLVLAISRHERRREGIVGR